MKREQKKNIENLEKVIEEKKKIPKEVRDIINSKVFENIAIVAIILIYFTSLYFGMTNIPTDMYLTDLRVFSIILLISTIIIFEYGYKKDKRRNLASWCRGNDYSHFNYVSYIFIFFVLLDLWNNYTMCRNYIFSIFCNKNCNNSKTN